MTTETKPRVRRFLIYYFFSTVFLAIAGLLISWHRSFWMAAIACLAGFVVLAAFGLRLQLINYGSTHKKATRWWWMVVLLGVVLCAWLFWWERTHSTEKPPVVTLEINPSESGLREKAFPIHFNFHNQNDYPIFNVEYKAYWNDPVGATRRTIWISFDSAGPIPELGAHMAHSMSLAAIRGIPKVPLIFVTVEVNYSTKTNFSLQTTNRFQFGLMRDNDGKSQWGPAGNGNSLEEIAAINDKQPVSWLDVFPLFDIRVIAFEKLPSDVIGANRTRMMFSAKNLSGEICTNLVSMWQVAHVPDYKTYGFGAGTAITNVTAFFNDDMVTNILYLPDTKAFELFDGVMSGEWVLAATLYASGLDGYDLKFDIKLIRTNSNFEVRILESRGLQGTNELFHQEFK